MNKYILINNTSNQSVTNIIGVVDLDRILDFRFRSPAANVYNFEIYFKQGSSNSADLVFLLGVSGAFNTDDIPGLTKRFENSFTAAIASLETDTTNSVMFYPPIGVNVLTAT